MLSPNGQYHDPTESESLKSVFSALYSHTTFVAGVKQYEPVGQLNCATLPTSHQLPASQISGDSVPAVGQKLPAGQLAAVGATTVFEGQ